MRENFSMTNSPEKELPTFTMEEADAADARRERRDGKFVDVAKKDSLGDTGFKGREDDEIVLEEKPNKYEKPKDSVEQWLHDNRSGKR